MKENIQQLMDEEKALQEQLRDVEENIRLERARCKHHYINRNGFARCDECGDRPGGWFCPQSPNGLCDYEDGEFCSHCGEPDERK